MLSYVVMSFTVCNKADRPQSE